MNLLKHKPFELTQHEKRPLFLSEMKASLMWHYQNSREFKKLCDSKSFDVKRDYDLADIPYLPVTIFKEYDLLSVPEDEIVKTLYSSSTSGHPSKIAVDKTTTDRQAIALNAIMRDYLGMQRREFIVFDAEETVKSSNGDLSSRGTAIRGMLTLSKGMKFVLDKNLDADEDKFNLVRETVSDKDVCFFGFTWLIYQVYQKYKDDPKISEKLREIGSADANVLHIGGWKKLKDISVSKEQFNSEIAEFLGVRKENIIDFYGMTEQLGTVYPDCPAGYKHAPLYSEIIIRDVNTLEALPSGEIGFIQLLSPIPHSYPGISLLSDDMGKIIGEDDCPCGRKGKYFVFEKRSEKAELKGCGDSLALDNYSL